MDSKQLTLQVLAKALAFIDSRLAQLSQEKQAILAEGLHGSGKCSNRFLIQDEDTDLVKKSSTRKPRTSRRKANQPGDSRRVAGSRERSRSRSVQMIEKERELIEISSEGEENSYRAITKSNLRSTRRPIIFSGSLGLLKRQPGK